MYTKEIKQYIERMKELGQEKKEEADSSFNRGWWGGFLNFAENLENEIEFREELENEGS